MLYREDIIRLHAMLQGAEEREVVVRADGYEYDGIDELLEKGGQQLDDLSLTVRTMVHVQVWKQLTSIDTRSNPEARELFEDVVVYLRKKRRRRLVTRVMVSRPVVMLMMFVAAFGALWWLGVPRLLESMASSPQSRPPVVPAGNVLAASSLLLAALLYAVMARVTTSTSLIFLTSRGESPRFWQKNRDGILINATSILAGFGLGLLTKHYL